MWPEVTDFSGWDWDIYISDDPEQLPANLEPTFGWCRIAVRKIDGIIEKVTEWRFTVEHPDGFDQLAANSALPSDEEHRDEW